MACLVRILRETNPLSNNLGECIVGFDGRFLGNLRVGGSVSTHADPGFHSVSITIAAHPNRRLSIYVPDDARSMNFFVKINPLNNEVALDQHRETPPPRPEPRPAEDAPVSRPTRAEPARRETPEKSNAMGAAAIALGLAGVFNAFYFHNYVVGVAALVLGLLTVAISSQRAALGVTAIFLAAVAIGAATLLETGLAVQNRPQTTQSETNSDDRMRSLSGQQSDVLLDGDLLKVTFRRLYEVSFAEGECYLQLKMENRSGLYSVLRLANVSINGQPVSVAGGLSSVVRPGETLTNPYVLTYGDSGVSTVDEINSIAFEVIMTSNEAPYEELVHSGQIELYF